MNRTIASLIVLALACSDAKGNEVFIGVELGRGSVDIETDRLAPVVLNDENTTVGGLIVGYRFDTGGIAELTYSGADSDNLLNLGDSLSLDEIRLSGGYAVALGKRFSLTPKIGISFWRLEGSEGILLNPGPEEVRKLDGEDVFFELTGGFEITSRWTLFLSHSRGNYNFGDSSATRLGGSFNFR